MYYRGKRILTCLMFAPNVTFGADFSEADSTSSAGDKARAAHFAECRFQ